MDSLKTPSLIARESFSTAHFPSTQDGSDSKSNLPSKILDSGLILPSATSKALLILNMDELFVCSSNSEVSTGSPKQASIENINEVSEDLLYFILTLSPMYRICMISKLNVEETYQLLQNQGVYKLIEGYICSSRKENKSSGPIYVIIRGTFTEAELSTAVYINCPEWLFESYKDRKLSLPPLNESSRDHTIKNLLAFLVHLNYNSKAEKSISALYEAFQSTYGDVIPTSQIGRKSSLDDENILELESDDSVILDIKPFESSVVDLKSKIFSSHYYEEICDFDDVKRETPQHRDSGGFTPKILKSQCSMQGSKRFSALARGRTLSDDGDSDIFSRHFD